MKCTGKTLEVVTIPPGSGYGNAACEYVAGLSDYGVPVSWRPYRSRPNEWVTRKFFLKDAYSPLRQRLKPLFKRRVKPDVLLLAIPPVHAYPQLLASTRAEHRFAYIAWELATIRPEWVETLNSLDGVFVPCQFNRDALLAGGITRPVSVVPHIARQLDDVAVCDANLPVPDDDFLFYTIGSWTTRKAMEDTVRAYLSAFTAADPVTLAIRTDIVDGIAVARKGSKWPAYSVAWTLATIIADYPTPARIHLMSDRATPEAIDALHRRGDCYVSLTHSEGWGLGAFDALLHNKPVIMTGFGGQLDYLGANYPLLVDFKLELVSNAEPDWHFHDLGHCEWAQADRQHAADLMRRVFESPEESRQMAMVLGRDLRGRLAAPDICASLGKHLGVLH